jgi:hypothetical protein
MQATIRHAVADATPSGASEGPGSSVVWSGLASSKLVTSTSRRSARNQMGSGKAPLQSGWRLWTRSTPSNL